MFGLVEFYNALPQWVADISQTNVFQRVVQRALIRISLRNENWPSWIRNGWKDMSCGQFDAAFSKDDLREVASANTEFEQFVEVDSSSDADEVQV